MARLDRAADPAAVMAARRAPLSGYGLLAAPFITLFPAAVAQRLWHRFPLYWQRLTLLPAR